MTADRPAAHLWAAADRERQLVRNVQEAEWRRRMLRAGHIDPAQLSNQASRILAWLAEWDDWTVDGVAELLTAAHRSGLAAARPAPASSTPYPTGDTAAKGRTPRTHRRASGPEHVAATEHDEPSMPVDAGDRSLNASPVGDRAGTATAGSRPLPTPAGHDPISARLAELQQRPESPAVGL
jgi:hypothetical protein